MPVTIAKTWQFSLASVGAGASLLAQNRDILLRIKNAMKAFGTNPWTVIRSSNGTTTSAADNWSAVGDLIWANTGSTHSWIVLQQTGISASFQILISLEPADGNGSTLSMWASPSAGFTGGSGTTRATATDEAQLYAAEPWTYGTTTAATTLMVAQTTDGQCTRVMLLKGSVGPAVWILDKVQGVSSALSGLWTSPFLAWILGTSGGDSNAATLGQLTTVANGKLIAPVSPAIVGSVFLASEGPSTPLINTTSVVNDASAEWPLAPVELICETAGARGHWGYLADCWMGANATIVTGDVYPSGVSRTLLQTGLLVMPWDGSVPPTGGTARDGDTFAGVGNTTAVGIVPYAAVAGALQVLGALAFVPKNEAI